MQEPTFRQEQKRSLVVPVLLAAVLLGLALLVVRHFAQPGGVAVALLHTDILPTKTVLQTNGIVVGANEVNHTLFVASTLRVYNQRRYPVSLDDFVLTLTDPSGAQLSTKAVTRRDLPNLELEFPKLKTLMATPLLRDASVDAGKSAEGTLIFSMPLTQKVWDTRKSAEIEVDIYHDHPLSVTIPK